MRNFIKTIAVIACVVAVSGTSVMVIFAKSIGVSEETLPKEASVVDPYMAVLVAIIAGVIGIIVFVKRNKIFKND